ncbi:MAG: hypothetical protein ACQGTM_06120 [bacterium]
MKTIKIFDGIKVTTGDNVIKYPDMTAFDEAVKCTEEQRGDIIRGLLMNGGTIDLSEFTTPPQRLILDLYHD